MHPISYSRSAQLQAPDARQRGVDPRLKPAAHAFEASLIQELLKPMQHDPLFSDSDSGGMGGLEGGVGDSGMDTVSSLGTQALARAISDDGGLGIAAEVLKQVHAEKEGETKKKTTSSVGRVTRLGQSHLLPWSSVRRLP